MIPKDRKTKFEQQLDQQAYDAMGPLDSKISNFSGLMVHSAAMRIVRRRTDGFKLSNLQCQQASSYCYKFVLEKEIALIRNNNKEVKQKHM